MGLFSFGKKKEELKEYYPESPDRVFDEESDRIIKALAKNVEGSIMTYIYKLFRNNLFAIDKMEELNTKIDRLENILLKQNQELQQKNSMLEAELEHTERHK